MKKTLIFAIAVAAASCGRTEQKTAAASHGMQIRSAAFADGAAIPKTYGCSGSSISPPLSITGVPQNAKTVALVVTDPDAPGGTFTHWLVWNMPPRDTSIAEGATPGGTVGQNDFGKSGYGAPCPPNGTHHYVFDVYALDTSLNAPAGAKRADVEAAMKGHVIAQARITGTYTK